MGRAFWGIIKQARLDKVGGGGGGPTLLMSVHPLILAKCSQNRQTKIDKIDNNYFLRFEDSWMLIIDVCSFKMICKSHRL